MPDTWDLRPDLVMGYFWVILAFGAALRFFRLDAQSLWLDEGLQFFAANAESLLETVERAKAWANPPLSYIITHLFLLPRSSDFFFRLPSTLFSIGSLPLLFLLAKSLISKQAAIFAVLIMAVSPLHVWFSQDGRMYSQLIFFCLLSTIFIWKAIEQGRWYWWALYAAAVVAGMGTQVFMGFAAFSHLAWLLLCHRRRLPAFGVALGAAALPFLPWAGLFLHSFRVSAGKSDLLLGALPYTLFTYAAGFSFGPSIADLHENRSIGIIQEFLPAILPATFIFGILLVAGLIALQKSPRRESFFLCLFGLCVPLWGALIYSLSLRYNVRYTVAAFPYFCIIAGTALAFIFRRNTVLGIFFIAAVLTISASSLYNYFTDPRYAKEDVRSAVAFWKGRADNLRLLSNVKYPVIRYLAEEDSKRHFSIPYQFNEASAIKDLFERHGLESAYVLLARDWHGQMEKAVRESFNVGEEKTFPGVKVMRVHVAGHRSLARSLKSQTNQGYRLKWQAWDMRLFTVGRGVWTVDYLDEI